MRRAQHPLWVALCVAWAGLAACSSGPRWGLKDISGLAPELAFSLTDPQRHTWRAQDFRCKVTLLYFGYTHCPDICPTTLARLSQAIRALGPRATAVRVLFISVDPARDSPEVLRDYARAFGPQFVGLSGRERELRALNKRDRLTYSLGEPDARGDYEVTHSSAVFIFDRSGAPRLLATRSDPVATITADLGRLIAVDAG